MNYLAFVLITLSLCPELPSPVPLLYFSLSLSLSELCMMLSASTQQYKMHVLLSELLISQKPYSEIPL